MSDPRCFRCPSAKRQNTAWQWLYCADALREVHSTNEPAPVWCPRINHPNRYREKEHG